MSELKFFKVKVPGVPRQYFNACVDAEDFHKISGKHWTVCKKKSFDGLTDMWVAVNRTRDGRRTYLHRLVLDNPVGMRIRHLNRDGLDCRRANMELLPTIKKITV